MDENYCSKCGKSLIKADGEVTGVRFTVGGLGREALLELLGKYAKYAPADGDTAVFSFCHECCLDCLFQAQT